MMRFLAVVGFDPYRQTSVPPTATPTVSAAGKKMPVLVSPVLVTLGVDALPSGIYRGIVLVTLVELIVTLSVPPVSNRMVSSSALSST
jgi:hypothetical protein